MAARGGARRAGAAGTAGEAAVSDELRRARRSRKHARRGKAQESGWCSAAPHQTARPGSSATHQGRHGCEPRPAVPLTCRPLAAPPRPSFPGRPAGRASEVASRARRGRASGPRAAGRVERATPSGLPFPPLVARPLPRLQAPCSRPPSSPRAGPPATTTRRACTVARPLWRARVAPRPHNSVYVPGFTFCVMSHSI